MMEFMMTLAAIALVFIIATILVALAAGTLFKLRKTPPEQIDNMRVCARNAPWP